MTVPFALVIIKPLSVRRGDAPAILEAILDQCPVSLRLFRSWVICRNTLDALNHSRERLRLTDGKHGVSWICLFTHLDRVTNPTTLLGDYFGSPDPTQVLPGSLRHQFGGFSRFGPTAHPTDDAVYLAEESRASFEAMILFTRFREEEV